MKNRYTAEEMREMALVEESYGWDVESSEAVYKPSL